MGGGVTRKPQTLPDYFTSGETGKWGRLLTFLQEGRTSSDWATQHLFDLYPDVLKCYQAPVNQQRVVLCRVGLRSIIRFSQSVAAPSRGAAPHP